jgi:hypothetical protein
MVQHASVSTDALRLIRRRLCRYRVLRLSTPHLPVLSSAPTNGFMPSKKCSWCLSLVRCEKLPGKRWRFTYRCRTITTSGRASVSSMKTWMAGAAIGLPRPVPVQDRQGRPQDRDLGAADKLAQRSRHDHRVWGEREARKNGARQPSPSRTRTRRRNGTVEGGLHRPHRRITRIILARERPDVVRCCTHIARGAEE